MRSLTHVLFTIAILLFYMDHFTLQSPILFILLTIFATLIVDIDHAHSKAGKLLQPFSYILKWLFGHRGLLHSILVPICIFLILTFLNYSEEAIAILIGYTSHIAMDLLTPAGVRIFYPLKFKIHGPIKVGSWAEYMLMICVAITITVKLFFVLW
jgi:inner membrane protein